MYTCNYCSLQFSTQQDLNVHTEECPHFSKPHICEYCKTKFITAKKLVAHEVMCEGKFRSIMTSQFESINNSLTEFKQVLTEVVKQLKQVECRFCLLKCDTVEEVNAHKKTCTVLATINIVRQFVTNLSATLGDEQLSMTSLPSASLATSSDVIRNPIDSVRTIDNASMPPPLPPKPSPSKEKSPKNRILDTDTERECTTKSESSPEPFSPLSPMLRSSTDDITDIETKLERIVHSVAKQANKANKPKKNKKGRKRKKSKKTKKK